MFLFFSLREPDVHILPASGLDYIELENFHTGTEESVDEGSKDTTEESEDYTDDDRPRKDNKIV